MIYRGYEAVIGVEVHVELKTAEKAFCACSATYGGEMNSKCCPVCLGMPGALPMLNSEAVRLAVTAGLALGCDISRVSRFDRKHYFYPDLPKGYQITQFYDPLCRDGQVKIYCGGEEKTVRIERIHLEEDAGKLSYEGDVMTVDHNRCGVPLIEIVTKPDMTSPEEAMAFVSELRRILLFAGVSDCMMNEGSLRCDVNVSVRPAGAAEMGNRCEIKNINSINFIGRAIESEIKRQTDIILDGGEISVETRRFDESTCKTEFMRQKESTADYRYIREPDLPAILTDEAYVSRVRDTLPKLPRERMANLATLGVKEQTASLICSEPRYAEYFDGVLEAGADAPAAANMLVSEVIPVMDEGGEIPVPAYLAECVGMYLAGDVNIVSARKLLKKCVSDGISPREAAEKYNMFILRDEGEIRRLVALAAEQCDSAVREIKKGKLTAKKVIIGCVMKLSGGRAEPTLVNRAVDEYFGC